RRRARVVVVVVVRSPPHGRRATAADHGAVGQQGGRRVRPVPDGGGPQGRAVGRRVRGETAVGRVDVDLVPVVRQHHRRPQAPVGQGCTPQHVEGSELTGDQSHRHQLRIVGARRPRGEVGGGRVRVHGRGGGDRATPRAGRAPREPVRRVVRGDVAGDPQFGRDVQ